MYKLPHELPQDLKLKMLGNKEILKKSLKCLELTAYTQPATQKTDFESCARKLQKIYCKTFHRKTFFTYFCLISL